MGTEALPYHPFDSVTNHGRFHPFLRDGQSQSRMGQPVFREQHGEDPIDTPPVIRENPLVFGWPEQPERAAESLPTVVTAGIQRDQAASRLRPLALLALMILRPLRVFMRARNPWLRLRFRLLG